MALREPSLESPVEQKISWARDVFHRLKHDLLGDPVLAGKLSMLKEAALQSRSEMARLGIGNYCRACEEEEGGSCCGAGLENHYSAALLLLNLLLDMELPRTREDPKGCFFLSKAGCRLLARHVLCINYLCGRITSRMSAQELGALREKEGIEVGLLFAAHERIRSKLASSNR